MKYKHYAPNAKCILVYSDNKTEMLNKMLELEKLYDNAVVLTNKSNVNLFSNATSMGSNLKKKSHKFFRIFKEV